jgi:hypothetical protein
LEELFHITVQQIPVGLIDKLVRVMRPQKCMMKKGYVLVFFTFEDLEQLLRLCRKAGLQSPLFPRWPRNLIGLIQLRVSDVKAEIASLCLLPVVHHSGKAKDFVNPYFVDDLRSMV